MAPPGDGRSGREPGPQLALAQRIHVEEAALRGHLGEADAGYARKTTRRLVPGVY